MKKLMTFVILLACLITVPALAQDSDNDTVTVKRSQLTQDQRNALEAQATKNKIETYGKWVGVGHELGTAVNESLAAVTTNATAFAGTNVGKMTMALVIWKVAGMDIAKIIVGFFILLVGIPVWVFAFYKNCITHRELIENSKDKGKKWEVVNIWERSGEIAPMTMQRIWHFLALFAFGMFTTLLMFS
jgi:hypothetical protein